VFSPWRTLAKDIRYLRFFSESLATPAKATPIAQTAKTMNPITEKVLNWRFPQF